ncbi:unnamed protein product, partial [Didymodactylos carnosus]
PAEMQSSCTREIPKNDILSLLMQDQEKEQPEPIQKGSLEKSGLYTHYYRHRDKCSYCTPELEEEKQQKMEEKQQQFQALDDSK